ncbi:MAG TPA: HAMP domain-containing sensor histidine kinase [Candidatus Paceibacterota bacterium]
MAHDDLIKENQKLKEVVALKSNLISMTAHDLRTGAVAQKWILKMLLDRDAGVINEEQETLLKKAYESNERSIEMISEFLAANQSEDATLSFKFEKADALALMESVISDLTPAAKKQGIKIIYAAPKNKIPELKIDQPKIRIVLQNLIDNAIKYSERGGQVQITINSDAKFVEFSVKDSGIGIRDEDKDKIFTKFFRTENAKKKREVGTGLGLPIIKLFVEKHGGKVWFSSEGVGRGSTFYFTLPL